MSNCTAYNRFLFLHKKKNNKNNILIHFSDGQKNFMYNPGTRIDV